MKKQHPFQSILRQIVVCLMCVAVIPTWAQGIHLTITGTTVDSSKVYDGTTTTPSTFVHCGTVSGIQSGHSILILGSANFLDANVGAHKMVVVRYAVLGANASSYTAPDNDTLFADITPRVLYAHGTQIATNKVYDATSHCDILNYGTFDDPLPGDTVRQIVTASYLSTNAAMFIPVRTTHITTGPQSNNYHIADTHLHYANILPRPVSATGAQVQLVKEYDGTDTAIVTRPAIAVGFIPTDSTQLLTSANYNGIEIGRPYNITLHYTLSGSKANNYTCPVDTLYSTMGAIISPVVLDATLPSAIYPLGEGFCQNTTATIAYHLSAGEPTHYRLTFDEFNDFLFNNTDWTPCNATDTTISFTVPSNCPAGRYRVYVTFLNEALVETAPIPVDFIVNLPNTYIVQVFDDVVSIVNTELDAEGNGRFKTFQWYHDGYAIPDATLPYYQDPNGLNGNYSVRVNIDLTDEALVCPISRFVRTSSQKAIHANPNPVVSATRIVLEGFDQQEHTLQLFNSYGVKVLNVQFSGSEYTLNLATLSQGTYLLSIDGTTIKTMKL